MVGLLMLFGLPFLANRMPERVPALAGRLLRYGGRLGGVFVIVLSVAATSFVQVPDGHFGKLFKVYGNTGLEGGKIVAINGEKGPQGRILAPGFNPELFINIIYDVDMSTSETQIKEGEVGILTARDGAALEPGQSFANPFPTELGFAMLDADTFLKNGGQRGPQLTVLTPGKYRLNPYLWDVEVANVLEIAAGTVGVVKSNVYADVDFGTLKATKPENCTPENLRGAAEGQIEVPLVNVGCVGVWTESLAPGKYYLNSKAFTVTPVDTKAQVWNYAGGYTKATISLTVDAKGEIVQDRTDIDVPENGNNADRAVFVKMEGWDVPLELRVVAQVSPENAACVVAGVGGLKEVEDRVLTPSIRAITRDVAGGTYEVEEPKLDENGTPIMIDGKPEMIVVERPTKVTDLINQRPLIEGEIEKRIRPEGQKACVDIREVRLGEPAIPPELLVAMRREQLATQLSKAFIQEQAAQTERIASEKAKATANQQETLVTAEIGVQASVQNAEAARNEGIGERDKLTAIAEGQKAQMEILGVDATVQLRQYELIVGKAFEFMNAHPDVIKDAVGNAQKFVPNIMVGGDSGNGGMLSALLGQVLQGGGIPVSVTPATTGQ
jgi:hypothetical protein